MKGGLVKPGVICLTLVLAMAFCGAGYARWSDTVSIQGTITTAKNFDVGGTCGFWKEWDKHNTYTEQQVLGWLGAIDASSAWLVGDADGNDDIDVRDMEAILGRADDGKKNNDKDMEGKFLAHYLALRLNMEARPLPRLNPKHEHDITAIAGYRYLALDNPSAATLSQIVQAIESKYVAPEEDTAGAAEMGSIESKPPTDDQFEIMKDICDALNNLEI